MKELDLLEKIEKMTDPLKVEGEWLTKIDLVEQGSKLTLKEMEDAGKCGTECKTIQSAAEGIIESADTDMAEKLWQVGAVLQARKMDSSDEMTCHSYPTNPFSAVA